MLQSSRPRYQGRPGRASLAEVREHYDAQCVHSKIQGGTMSRKDSMTFLSPYMAMEASDVFRRLCSKCSECVQKSVLAMTKSIPADANPTEIALGPQLIEDPVGEMCRRLAEHFPVYTLVRLMKLIARKPGEAVTICHYRFIKGIELSQTTVRKKDLAIQFLRIMAGRILLEKENADYALQCVDERFAGTGSPTGSKVSSDDNIKPEDHSEEDEDHPPLSSCFQSETATDHGYQCSLQHYLAAVAISNPSVPRDPLKRSLSELRHNARTGNARYPTSFKVIDDPSSEVTPRVVTQLIVPAQALPTLAVSIEEVLLKKLHTVHTVSVLNLKDIGISEKHMIQLIKKCSIESTSGSHEYISVDPVNAETAFTMSEKCIVPCRPPKERSAKLAAVAILDNTNGVV
eukprot:SM000453S16106  [mRNA]  locus=s453:20341:21913:+ [translate_table: standard]